MARLIGVIEVERVDFVSVPTRDLARSRRFYGEVLGLRTSRTNPDEFEAGNLTLTLWQPEAQSVPFSPNTAGIAFRVADVHVAREHLAARGVEFLGDIVDTGVCLMGFFYDPDGNVLILHRRYAPLHAANSHVVLDVEVQDRSDGSVCGLVRSQRTTGLEPATVGLEKPTLDLRFR